MSKKQHDFLRLLQLIIPDLASLYGVLDVAFGWGHISVVEACVPIIISIISHIAQASSNTYFSTKSIVTKILPDKEVEQEAE